MHCIEELSNVVATIESVSLEDEERVTNERLPHGSLMCTRAIEVLSEIQVCSIILF